MVSGLPKAERADDNLKTEAVPGSHVVRRFATTSRSDPPRRCALRRAHHEPRATGAIGDEMCHRSTVWTGLLAKARRLSAGWRERRRSAGLVLSARWGL